MSDADKNTRFQLVVSSSLLNEIREWAVQEHRSISNMIVVLLMEAVKERKAKKAKEGNSPPARLVNLTAPNSAGF